MRVIIIDTRNMGPELQRGLIGVEGSSNPTAPEKQECVETVSTYATDGWAIAADPHTPVGWLAALTAEAVCVPFINLTRIALEELTARRAHSPDHLAASVTVGHRLKVSGIRSRRFLTNLGFARQNGLENTTCRY